MTRRRLMRCAGFAVASRSVQRCSEAATPHVEVDAREVDSRRRRRAASPYVQGGDLDVHARARDALALSLPSQILSCEGFARLCPICGATSMMRADQQARIDT